MIETSRNAALKDTFNKTNAILTLRQPKNLIRLLTTAKFNTMDTPKRIGLFKCTDKRCLICTNNWLQECKSFTTANNKLWEIKSEITCKSLNVIYYLVCFCCHKVSYTGKTSNLRLRTNQHISECRHGKGMNQFDRHVYSCRHDNNKLNEPFFGLYTFMTLQNETSLLPYEAHFHKLGYDTMN